VEGYCRSEGESVKCFQVSGLRMGSAGLGENLRWSNGFLSAVRRIS
jgi:hypothetical protein